MVELHVHGHFLCVLSAVCVQYRVCYNEYEVANMYLCVCVLLAFPISIKTLVVIWLPSIPHHFP